MASDRKRLYRISIHSNSGEQGMRHLLQIEIRPVANT